MIEASPEARHLFGVRSAGHASARSRRIASVMQAAFLPGGSLNLRSGAHLSGPELHMSGIAQECASMIADYWAARGYAVRPTVSGDSVVSDMIGGLPKGYSGPLTKPYRTPERVPPDRRHVKLRVVGQ